MNRLDEVTSFISRHAGKILGVVALMLVLCCCGTVGYQVVADNKLESCTDSNGSVHWYKTEKQDQPCW